MSSPHTEHGLPGTPQPNQAQPSSWWNTALIICCVVLVYLVAMQNDQIDELQQDIIQQQLDNDYDLGQYERLATAKIAAAYAQGQRDAIDALKPQSALQVAQLCQAWRYADAGAPQRSNRAGG